MSRNRQNLRLKQRKARQAKLQKLREQYDKTSSSSEKDNIRDKITKIAPYLTAKGALDSK